jgi:hypothetical protein
MAEVAGALIETQMTVHHNTLQYSIYNEVYQYKGRLGTNV